MADKPPSSMSHHKQPSITPQKMFLEQTTLYFPPPLSTRSISNSVTVYNRSEVQCIFKVHSAEPELYVVKPSAGILAPKSAMRVVITLRKMSSEPSDLADFGRKQRFKVRGKVIPPAIAAKLTSSPHAGDVWKQLGDSTPIEMDSILTCNFSGEVPKGADVSFDTNADVVSPVSKEDPYATAKRTAAVAAAAKNVTFGEGGTSANGNGTMKSSLKGGEGVTPKNANDLVNAESAGIKTNTTTKQALAGAVGDFRDQKTQLEKEIKDRQSLLANLKASTLPSNSGSPDDKKKKKMPKMSLGVALVLMIVFYVAGTVARVHVGGDNVTRYVQTYVPAEVRSALITSRMALDDAVAPILKQVSDQYAAVTGSGGEVVVAADKEVVVADAPQVMEEAKESKSLETQMNSDEKMLNDGQQEAANTAQQPTKKGEEKKMRRKKKKVTKEGN